MAFVMFLGLCVLIAFIFALPFILRDEGRRKEMERQIEALPGFVPALRMEQPDRAVTVLLDPDSSQFVIAKPGSPVRAYAFDQLVSVEVQRNGASLQKSNRGSQLMGAAVGGALLGPLGLLLGGLSGSKRSEELVQRLSLKLFTSDLHAPVSEIIFFDSTKGQKPDSPPVKAAAMLMDEWHARFLTILNGQERARPVPEDGRSEPPAFGRRRGLLAGR
jgi:hypothetical protein